MIRESQAAAYLAALERSLKGLNDAERAAALDDIRSHLAEAQAAGLSEADAIARLGPAEALGRAFVAELTVDRVETDRAGWIDTLLRLAGLLAIGSLPTIVIVSVLGAVGAVFFGVGIMLFGAAVWALAVGGPGWMSWDNLSPPLALLVGPLMAVAGLLALYLLYRYLRFLAAALIRTIPFRRKASAKRTGPEAAPQQHLD